MGAGEADEFPEKDNWTTLTACPYFSTIYTVSTKIDLPVELGYSHFNELHR